MLYIYKMRWHVTYASCCCLWIFETSSLVFVIANGGTVSLNAPWGLIISHPKSLAKVLSAKISKLIFSSWIFTHDVLSEILIQNKNWRIKLWRIYGHLPNLPKFFSIEYGYPSCLLLSFNTLYGMLMPWLNVTTFISSKKINWLEWMIKG